MPSGIYCLLFSGYNSRSPAESDDDICEEDMRDIATTHALLRRATPLAVEPLDDALATTQALLRRATIHHSFLSVSFVSYNSRSPAESDFALGPSDVASPATTHALLRRATFKYCWFTLIQMATTHALLRRATACRKSLFASLSKFSELYKSSENLGFQWRRTPFLGFPRTPFLTVAENLPLYRQSHALLRRATTIGAYYAITHDATTHALLRRATRLHNTGDTIPKWLQLTLSCGERR